MDVCLRVNQKALVKWICKLLSWVRCINRSCYWFLWFFYMYLLMSFYDTRLVSVDELIFHLRVAGLDLTVAASIGATIFYFLSYLSPSVNGSATQVVCWTIRCISVKLFVRALFRLISVCNKRVDSIKL